LADSKIIQEDGYLSNSPSVLLHLTNSGPAKEELLAEDDKNDPPCTQIERSAPTERRKNDKLPMTQEGAKMNPHKPPIKYHLHHPRETYEQIPSMEEGTLRHRRDRREH